MDLAAFEFFVLDGVLRNFDLGKVPLCLFVRGKLGRASCVQCGESELGDDTHLEDDTHLGDEPHFHLQVAVLDLDLDFDQSSQIETLKSWLKTWGQTTVNTVRNSLAKSFSILAAAVLGLQRPRLHGQGAGWPLLAILQHPVVRG